ncbi:inner membrane insertion protein OxaA [Gottschalkia purinilytica]|uniref:Inner membrane insertion protein OxaA n=1 Tax=Gottschalkia purinilytica TaxID=1503 RepID=A0A0L0W6P1_GOTPU|nr:membrane protein insertase YidC [Gottschalkia purinilytica]KNF07147.1 inner membrane insertion protein OxaA [Gottschalkia purinilytica]
MNIIFNLFENLLNIFFNFTNDWGIAIVLLTASVKLVFLPMTIKQKINMLKQKELSEKIQDLKTKYKDNKDKLESEMAKHYNESTKGFLGCLSAFLQIPFIYTLYRVVLTMPVESSTIIIPWVTSIKLSDSYFIVPMIYALISLSPNLLSYIKYLDVVKQDLSNKSNIVITIIFSILVTFKSPIAIGIYFITNSIFSLIEEVAYRIYLRKYYNINPQNS